MKPFTDKTIRFAIGALLVISGACRNGSQDDPAESGPLSRATVSDRGLTIAFPPESIGLRQITTTAMRKGTANIPVLAPARVVATIAEVAAEQHDKVLLFESQDITSLYSQYRQSKANLTRTQRNFDRTKDMYDNHGATAKDINDAETDLGTAKASAAEFQSKLRAAGFDPLELEAAPAGTAWMISDVPESELNEVQRGEEVDVMMSSFPDRKFVGHAAAIGDVVDPVTRTVKVRVTLPSPNRRFLPGMFARVDFGDPKTGVIILPASAVVSVEEKDFVFVESSPGIFHRREVVLATTTPSEVILDHGVEDGERVVVAGAMLLKGLSFGF
jgi:cobalt-zinc-cadmium efflux system membrane fusion protein